MNLTKRGFTLIELLVVVAMLAILMGSVGASVSGAQERAREQKATADVKVISQAILSYENYERGNENFELPTMEDEEATADNLRFLLGEGEQAKSGGKIPVLLAAALQGGKSLVDPWGKPYRIRIRETNVQPKFKTATGTMQTGFYLPNFYRISETER